MIENERYELIWKDTGEVYHDNETGKEYGVSPQYRFHIKDLLNKHAKEIKELKESDLIFFQAVWDILMKYQHLFNREMADEVLEDLGIELPRWFD